MILNISKRDDDTIIKIVRYMLKNGSFISKHTEMKVLDGFILESLKRSSANLTDIIKECLAKFPDFVFCATGRLAKVLEQLMTQDRCQDPRDELELSVLTLQNIIDMATYLKRQQKLDSLDILLNHADTKLKIERSSPNLLVNYTILMLEIAQMTETRDDTVKFLALSIESNISKFRKASNLAELEIHLYRHGKKLKKV